MLNVDKFCWVDPICIDPILRVERRGYEIKRIGKRPKEISTIDDIWWYYPIYKAPIWSCLIDVPFLHVNVPNLLRLYIVSF